MEPEAKQRGELCKAYMACTSFQNAYQHGKQFCEKCRGDIRPLTSTTRMLDTAVDPIIAIVLQRTPDETMPVVEKQVRQLVLDLAHQRGGDTEGVEQDASAVVEALLGMVYRLSQRVATLEGAVNRVKRGGALLLPRTY